jgi:hypothetical protein
MNIIWNGLLIAMAISWSGLVFSEQTEGQEAAGEASSPAPAEVAAPAETATKAADESLPSGIGWRLVRKLEMGNSGKFVNMVLIDKDRQMDKTVYSAAIHKLCSKEKEFCRIRFWIQEYFIPEKLTPTADQLKAQKADYLFNPAGGIHRTQWSCTVDHDRSQCIDW